MSVHFTPFEILKSVQPIDQESGNTYAGGDFGRGAITCRTGQHFTGHWSAPALFALEGANIGFQLAGEATDFVLLVMNPKGANSILNSKVKLGGDASAAAGPKGRTAAADTDIVMRAEVLSYSRARLVRRHFAGGLDASVRRRCEQKVVWPQP
jgi:lipid-binding SYLF domain-containing protein